MSKNVGDLDRLVRLIVGIGLLVLPFVFELGRLGGAISVVVGLVMLVVGATRVCPLYSIFGIKTCRTASE